MTAITRARPLILAVDDEPANLALLRKLLTHLGYDVAEASDGDSALRATAELMPDLVCLDVLMPGIDGIEVCQRIRRMPGNGGLPILLITALNRPEDTARGLESGANDFLSKPFNESELAARLRSLLRTKALQDRLADVLKRYVSDSIAVEALRDPWTTSLGGDRRHVSTLFADVRGYTALATQHSPEQALDLLNHYSRWPATPWHTMAEQSATCSATGSSRSSAHRSCTPTTRSEQFARRSSCSPRLPASTSRRCPACGSRRGSASPAVRCWPAPSGPNAGCTTRSSVTQ